MVFRKILVEITLSEGRVVLKAKRKCNKVLSSTPPPEGAPSAPSYLDTSFDLVPTCFTSPRRLAYPHLYPYHLTQSFAVLGACIGEDSGYTWQKHSWI